ncbi:MAG: LysM peptidoglycan-binding domain-containing protein [bacterium]
MRITKLHLIILLLILAGGGYWGYLYFEKMKDASEEQERQSLLLERKAKHTEEEKSAQRYIDEKANDEIVVNDAREALVVAIEMLEKAQGEGKDVSMAEMTIQKAEESLEINQYKQAWSLARQAIEEIRQTSYDQDDVSYKAESRPVSRESAKPRKSEQPREVERTSKPERPKETVKPKETVRREGGNIVYVVQRGDNLWNISKMGEHYGLGSKWVGIWRTNEKEIPDFDLIYPGQEIIIPVD